MTYLEILIFSLSAALLGCDARSVDTAEPPACMDWLACYDACEHNHSGDPDASPGACRIQCDPETDPEWSVVYADLEGNNAERVAARQWCAASSSAPGGRSL